MRSGASELLGYSEERRPIVAHVTGGDDASLRVLVVAGQHGDEGLARIAAERFVSRKRKKLRRDVCLAVVHDANPDGGMESQRHNARGVDLNRDHQLLSSAETRALHRFVRRFRPHVVADVHNYPPRRRHLLEKDLVYCHDVFLDVPTHPGIGHPLLTCGPAALLEPLLERIRERGYRAARYTLITPSGRIRHSTPDVVDARNGLALRYGALTWLVEGRQPGRRDSKAVRTHLLDSMVTALDIILDWSVENRATLTRPLATVPDLVPISTRYRASSGPLRQEFRGARSEQIRRVEIEGRYTPLVEARASVTPPLAYAVPVASSLVPVLLGHGFVARHGLGETSAVERYWIRRFRPARRSNRSPRRIELTVRFETASLDDYVVFPVNTEGGRALAVYLEPESRHALHRYTERDQTLRPESLYPVLRLVEGKELNDGHV